MSPSTVSDLDQCALALAGFLDALYRIDASDGPPAGAHSHSRGGPVGVWDAQTRDGLARLGGRIDVAGASAVWEAALEADGLASAPVWVHGDVTRSNLLAVDGRLSAVIDFGCSAVGDPACDTTIAWTFFTGESRALFKSQLAVDEATWARGRGWALWKALLELVADLSTPGRAAHSAVRFGWRFSPYEVIDEVIADHRAAS